MESTLLHVVFLVLEDDSSAAHALRRARHLLADGCAVLLFADLPPAAGQIMPGDAPLIRSLQSGVMALERRRPGSAFALVRHRAWNSAERRYLGAGQEISVREAVARLLVHGASPVSFAAATVSPASLRGCCRAVLFSDVTLCCTPDTPMRMYRALEQAGGAVGAPVLHQHAFPETVLARLAGQNDVHLSPLLAAKAHALARRSLCPDGCPLMLSAQALPGFLLDPRGAVPAAKGCFFVSTRAVTLRALYARHRMHTLRAMDAHAIVPLVQTALLFLSAASGLPVLAGTALLPEGYFAVHPRGWPGVLLRTALLPLTALVSLDAMLCRLFARSPALRIRVPDGLIGAYGCVLAGAALLALAVSGVQALAVLLPVSLAWLSAPLLLPALESPAIERIPLTDRELSLLRTLAEGAYFDAAQHHAAPPALQMLTACAGCMLGLLEPDEAGRQIQALLHHRPAMRNPAEHAAVLVCAQALRERMSACDAALRELPAQLDELVLAQPQPEASGLLGAWLRAAHAKEGAQPLVHRAGGALDFLFLPLQPVRRMARSEISLPLTHPHTFLRSRLLNDDISPSGRFLGLAAAALQHPFYPLLTRSPVTGPYAALLSI